MRILFAASPAIAVEALCYLHQHVGVSMLLCKPDAPFGRKRLLTPPPTKVAALALGIEVIQPEKLTSDVEELIRHQNIDFLVCFAYGKIFKQSFLDLFPMGAINLHPSLLPKWRGPTPINSAILNGDEETGITVQKLALKMDAGDIIIQERMKLTGKETSESLSGTVATLAGPLLAKAITCLSSSNCLLTEQRDEEATYCHLLTKADGLLNFTLDAMAIERHIRAMQPSPGSYAYMDDSLIYVHEASVFNHDKPSLPAGTVIGYDKTNGLIIQTAMGCLAVRKLQLAGKKILSHQDFINGCPEIIGKKLNERGI